MMDSRLLQAFAIVAEELHFGRAAARLHISQPPLSQTVRKLETLLGTPLLARSTRSVRLTPAGAELVRWLQRRARDEEAMLRAVREAASGSAGVLVIGLTPSAACSNLSGVLFAFRQQYPGIELDLREMSSEAMPQALRQRHLDLALLRPPFADPDLAPLPIYSEPMVVAMRHDHPLAARRWVSMRTVMTHDLVGYSRQHSRYFHDLQLAMVNATGMPARIVMESMIPTNLTLVEAGFGLALVPASLARTRTASLAYAAIRGRGSARAELVAARQPGSANAAVDHFIALMRRTPAHAG